MTDAPEMTRKKVVIISPVLPFDGITHAGGLYLQTLRRAIEAAGAEVTFLVDGANYWALDRPGAPARVVLLGVPLKGTFHGRLVARVVRELERLLRSRNPTFPRLPFMAHAMLSSEARKAVRGADVVDLHWPETARLIPWVRGQNPRARVICTLHDVLSQRWSRRIARGRPAQPAAERAMRAAQELERRTQDSADAVIVFSEKDRDLLSTSAGSELASDRIEVVVPPLAPAESRPRTPDRNRPVVVFVGLLDRPENAEAATWLVSDIWPSVVARVPNARLRIVGAGGPVELRDVCADAVNVELTGFVNDLAGEYAVASACVVPLRQGAGVKFKTVEALVAGVPTVTTSVGAEGIAGPERFAALTDDAAELANALVEVLTNADAAEAAARATQVWARARFDIEHLDRDVRRVYDLRS